MSSLPCEVWGLVFQYLDVRSLVRCRTVCKVFKSEVDRLRIKSLAVSFYSDNDVEDYYYYTNQSTRTSCSLRNMKKFKFIKNEQAYQMLCHLKQLMVKCFVRDEVNFTNFKLVNSLKQLEHLELVNVSIKLSEIKLKNLKILRVCPANILVKIKLYTPSLIAFKTTNSALCRFKFAFPESIESMEIGAQTSNVSNFEGLISFYCTNGNSLDDDIINQLPNLVNLGFDVISDGRISYLRKQRKVLRRTNLKFLRNGINIDCMDKEADEYITQNAFSKRNKSIIFFDNYSKFNVLPYIVGMNFNELSNYFQKGIPKDFFQKFISVRTLSVNGESVTNINEFIEFITNCKYLRTLYIENASQLGQEFYSTNLNASCPFLVELNLRMRPEDELDLTFIYDLPFLLQFSVNRQVSFDLINRAFYKLKYFEIFDFELGNKTVKVVIKRYMISPKIISILINNSISKYQNVHSLFSFLKELIGVL